MSLDKLSNVAYKKGNWMRYTLWGLAAICIVTLFTTFLGLLNSEVSANIPKGYNFSVTDNYTENSHVRTTYYVYNNRILVEDESFNGGTVNRALIVYDDVSAADLKLDTSDTIEICELGACHERPKVLAVIKKLISRKVGREYIGI